jgi:hypothetical protein
MPGTRLCVCGPGPLVPQKQALPIRASPWHGWPRDSTMVLCAGSDQSLSLVVAMFPRGFSVPPRGHGLASPPPRLELIHTPARAVGARPDAVRFSIQNPVVFLPHPCAQKPSLTRHLLSGRSARTPTTASITILRRGSSFLSPAVLRRLIRSPFNTNKKLSTRPAVCEVRRLSIKRAHAAGKTFICKGGEKDVSFFVWRSRVAEMEEGEGEMSGDRSTPMPRRFDWIRLYIAGVIWESARLQFFRSNTVRPCILIIHHSYFFETEMLLINYCSWRDHVIM